MCYTTSCAIVTYHLGDSRRALTSVHFLEVDELGAIWSLAAETPFAAVEADTLAVEWLTNPLSKMRLSNLIVLFEKISNGFLGVMLPGTLESLGRWRSLR